MGLTAEPISTQVIPRDRHAMFFATLGVVASSIERLAIEIRHLQRTEVLEAEEFFSEGQKGSSAMPHKRNPVLSENLTGLSRMVRAYVTPALENVALWHERDISHSSVERMIGPDATVTLDFALVRLTGLIDKLLVYPENMQKNLDRLGGLIHSQRVLLALTQKGAAREEAYRLVQRNAMPVWRGEGDFLTLLKADKDVTRYLSDAEIEENFDLGYHLKHVDTIFERVFGAMRLRPPVQAYRRAHRAHRRQPGGAGRRARPPAGARCRAPPACRPARCICGRPPPTAIDRRAGPPARRGRMSRSPRADARADAAGHRQLRPVRAAPRQFPAPVALPVPACAAMPVRARQPSWRWRKPRARVEARRRPVAVAIVVIVVVGIVRP